MATAEVGQVVVVKSKQNASSNFALKVLNITKSHEESVHSYSSGLSEQQQWQRTFDDLVQEKDICREISKSSKDPGAGFVIKTLSSFISPLDSSVALIMELAIGDVGNLLEQGELTRLTDIRFAIASIVEGVSFLQ